MKEVNCLWLMACEEDWKETSLCYTLSVMSKSGLDHKSRLYFKSRLNYEDMHITFHQ